MDLAHELNVAVPTLNTIIGQQEEQSNKMHVFSHGVKHPRGAKHQKIEDVLLTRPMEVKAAGVNVDR